MVDRIYIHASTTLPENSGKQRFNSFAVHHQVLSFAVVITSALAYTTSSSSGHPYNSFMDFALVVIFLILKHLIGTIQTRNQFQRAVIEITSFGVQLVSIYGPGSSHNDQNNKIHSTTSNNSVLDDQANVPVTHDNVDNTHHVHKRLLHKSIMSKGQIQSFIPRERIIDVIVMEVVWPHCVWSQVAFRVDKGSGSSLVQSKCCQSENGVEHYRRRPEPALDKDAVHDNKSVQSNVGGDTDDTDDQCTTTSLNIQALMKRNRIAIVPAFPEECRGLLSYKECLRLQEEIERLLGHSKTR